MLPESDIQQVITNILKREGGNVDDPEQIDQETHFGVTMQFASQYHLPWPPTLADARDGYRRMLAGTRIDQIPDAPTLDLVADSAVNHGASRAIKWLQLAVATKDDGIIGPKTTTVMMEVSELQWPLIYRWIFKDRGLFYASIVENDPSQLKFLTGWLNRLFAFLT